MITVRVIGGLGNQMFQYAAGFALSQRHGVTLRIDTSEFDGYGTWPYLLDRLQVPEAVAKAPARGETARERWVPRVFGKEREQPRPIYRQPFFHYDASFVDLTPPLRIEGYFQSARYFEGFEATIRERFQPAEALSPVSAAYAAEMAETSVPVSLHVRRGDYLRPDISAVHGTLSLDYYQRAVEIMSALHGDEVHFFLFSDDVDFVDANFRFCPRRTVVRGAAERPWEDLRLMSFCHHHVIANSSFSWWGAFLATDADQTVIAPRNWFTREKRIEMSMVDLYPDKWILV